MHKPTKNLQKKKNKIHNNEQTSETSLNNKSINEETSSINELIKLISINKNQTLKYENDMKDLLKQSIEHQEKNFSKILGGLNSKLDAVIKEKEELKMEITNLKETRNNNNQHTFIANTNDLSDKSTYNSTMGSLMHEFCAQQKPKEVKSPSNGFDSFAKLLVLARVAMN
jgi:hypothetical protein